MSSKKPRVIIVDDDREMRDLLSLALKQEGFDVTQAANGLRLIATLHADRPDIILLDVNMSWIDGYELCRAVRASEEFSAIPVVFVSGRSAATDVKRGLDAGASDYFTKPVEISTLVARIRQLAPPMEPGGRGAMSELTSPFRLDHYLQVQRGRVELLLQKRLEGLADRTPARLLDAMRYSLLGGGKRLRPILCLAFAEAVSRQGGVAPGRVADDSACALEYIHTYSLIHDDLPAMDDDDFRRGRPTNHKAHGEAMAVLAGDALLTEAFGVVLTGNEDVRLPLSRELAMAAGASGMVAGQALDIASDRPSDEGYLIRLHRLKTGALIRVACRMGVMASGGSTKQLEAAAVYGDCVGLAFQITDDILDFTSDPKKMGKPTQADAPAGRFTFPRVSGLPRSRSLAEERVDLAIAAIAELERSPGPLTALARYSVERES